MRWPTLVQKVDRGGPDPVQEDEPVQAELVRPEPEMDLEEKVPMLVEDALAQQVDQDALLAALLSQRVVQQTPVSGPEWSIRVRPPSIPGTINHKYTRIMLPARVLAMFVLWVTWHWARGLFVTTSLVLLWLIVVTRA